MKNSWLKTRLKPKRAITNFVSLYLKPKALDDTTLQTLLFITNLHFLGRIQTLYTILFCTYTMAPASSPSQVFIVIQDSFLHPHSISSQGHYADNSLATVSSWLWRKIIQPIHFSTLHDSRARTTWPKRPFSELFFFFKLQDQLGRAVPYSSLYFMSTFLLLHKTRLQH